MKERPQTTRLSLTVIVAAAALLGLTMGVMFYTSHKMLQQTVEQLVSREMNAIYLCIRNKLAKVEVTMDNMAWVAYENLDYPDDFFTTTRRLVKNNPDFLSSGIAFTPYFYKDRGKWFEPFSVRRKGGPNQKDTIEVMQLGSAEHDYTKMDFFTVPLEKKKSCWTKPYMDNEGAHTMVTTYSVPVYLPSGEYVAVVAADLDANWINEILEEAKTYKSTRRYLISGQYELLSGNDSPFVDEAIQRIKEDDTDHDEDGYITMKDERGEKIHVFYHAVGGKTDWILMNIVDDSEIFGKLRNIRLLLTLLVCAGLLALGFIIYRSTRNLQRLNRINAEKERIGGELQVASRIQQSMLPTLHLQRDDVEIGASLTPAREVGGDLYDYFIRDEKLFFCIGDTSGKGAPSAMLMAVTHSLFRAFSLHENNPARIMQAVNESACQGNDSNMFITFFIGVLDLPTGRLHYCDGGHDRPLILGMSGQEEAVISLECNPHLPVGVWPDTKYTAQEIMLSPGSVLFLYTDGLTEAKDLEHKQFGLERIKITLEGCVKAHSSLQEILPALSREVGLFVGEAEQSDDLAMLAIRYTPQRFESILDETLVLKNNVREISKLGPFFKDISERLEMDVNLARQLRLAVEEAAVNVIDYAYPAGTEGDVTLRVLYDGHCLKTMIIDSGIPFDPTVKERADTSLSAEDRQIGGLGILLVREMMDAINYERDSGQNVLTLIKHLKA
ncbi:MAG: SpoIIE family protein phosphatase [Bacteroidales bacterium]|nr:SpoIIE family protein phosphatase [Bacteroidales bacterium]